MKKITGYSILFVPCLICIIVLLFSCAAPQQSVTEIPSYPVEKGVSAPFAGFIGNRMFVGGGCNFPDVPAAQGGTKKYYQESFVFSLNSHSSEWSNVVSFPISVAYGASVETADGLVCIGGMNATGSLNSVFRVEVDELTGEVNMKLLPSLPEAIDNAAAALVGQTIYVTGGNQTEGGNSLYALCPDKDVAWKKLAAYPGPKRIQPVLLGTSDTLYLLGGFEVETDPKRAVISSDFLMYHVAEDRWSEPVDLPAYEDGSKRALVGASGVCVGNQLVIAGGVNYQIFQSAVEGKAPADYMEKPASWYQFSKELLVYDLNQRTWKILPGMEGMNKAGGCLLQKDGMLYMVCGEIKPGIRTSEIVSCQLPVDNL